MLFKGNKFIRHSIVQLSLYIFADTPPISAILEVVHVCELITAVYS